MTKTGSPFEAYRFPILFLFLLVPLSYLAADSVAQLPTADNVCQLTYWKILFRPYLAGSVGVAAPKSGLIILLGGADAISQALSSTLPVKLLLGFFASMLILFVAAISNELAGKWVATLAAITFAFLLGDIGWFSEVTSQLFFVPTSLWGIWYFAKKKEIRGTALLCIAITFRIEALGIFLFLFLSRRWPGQIKSAAMILLALIFHFWISYRVQGSFDRIDAGIGAGYNIGLLHGFGPADIFPAALNAYQGLWIQTLAVLSGIVFLFLPQIRIYLSLFGSLLIVALNAIWFNGTLREPYFQVAYPLFAAVGMAGSVRLGIILWQKMARKKLESEGSSLSSGWLENLYAFREFAVLAAIALFIWISPVIPFFPPAEQAFVSTPSFKWSVAQENEEPAKQAEPIERLALDKLMSGPDFPQGSAILMEDDLLFYFLIYYPDYVKRALAIPAFLVMPTEKKAEVIRNFDTIYLYARGNSNFPSFFNYLNTGEWEKDPYRMAIEKAADTGKPAQVGNVHFVPWANDHGRIMLKIEHK